MLLRSNRAVSGHAQLAVEPCCPRMSWQYIAPGTALAGTYQAWNLEDANKAAQKPKVLQLQEGSVKATAQGWQGRA